MNKKIRANAFAAFGTLSKYGIGEFREPFVEQVFFSFHTMHLLENYLCLYLPILGENHLVQLLLFLTINDSILICPLCISFALFSLPSNYRYGVICEGNF